MTTIAVYVSAHSGYYNIKRKYWDNGQRFLGAADLNTQTGAITMHVLPDKKEAYSD